MSYSMSADHYNDPYGYFILGSASCAGCTRATGLCLNILGIPYEHVNENQYSHQWCRVNVNGISFPRHGLCFLEYPQYTYFLRVAFYSYLHYNKQVRQNQWSRKMNSVHMPHCPCICGKKEDFLHGREKERRSAGEKDQRGHP